jgi:MFS family permease
MSTRARMFASVVSVATLYFLNGAVSASLAPRLAEMEGSLELDHASLGLALLTQALGMVITMVWLAGPLVEAFGGRRVAVPSAVLFSVGTGLCGFADAFWMLAAALFLAGLANAPLDVAAPSLAVDVEEARGRATLSLVEGAFAVGLLAGGAAGAWCAGRVAVSTHLGIAGATGAGLALAAWRWLPKPTPQPPGRHERVPTLGDRLRYVPVLMGIGISSRGRHARRTPIPPEVAGRNAKRPPMRHRLGYPPGLISLTLLAAASLWCEVAPADWGSLFYAELGAKPTEYGLGYLAFSGGLVVSLFAGGVLVDRIGAVKIVRFGAAVFALGMAVAVLSPSVPQATVALAVAGLGLGNVHPLTMSAAGRRFGPSGVAKLNISYLAFVVEKPVLGFVGEYTSLSVALGTSVFLGILMAIGARAVSPRTAAAS